MPKRNKIELQGLVERIVEMFYNEKLSQKAIAEKLREEGYDVSKSGVGRTLLTHAAQMEAYRKATMEAEAIVNELKNTPGLDVAEASVQMIQAKLLQEVQKISDFEDLETKEVLKAVADNTAAQARIAKVKLDYERGYRQGLFKAAEIVGAEGKKAGLSDETVEVIKTRIIGLKVE